MDGCEHLQTWHAPKAEMRPSSSSKRQTRIVRRVLQTAAGFPTAAQTDFLQRCRLGAQLVRDHDLRTVVRTHCSPQAFQSGLRITCRRGGVFQIFDLMVCLLPGVVFSDVACGRGSDFPSSASRSPSSGCLHNGSFPVHCCQYGAKVRMPSGTSKNGADSRARGIKRKFCEPVASRGEEDHGRSSLPAQRAEHCRAVPPASNLRCKRDEPWFGHQRALRHAPYVCRGLMGVQQGRLQRMTLHRAGPWRASIRV